MLIEDVDRAPLADARLDSSTPQRRSVDGMVLKAGEMVPGTILGLWLDLRKFTGVIVAKKKEGVKFKVRSAEDLIDRVREKANELGILIYPRIKRAQGHVVEDGTLAEQELEVWVQSVEDGSQLMFGGFGLGADNQDKAGGKAGTYAFKQALIQALLAGGATNAKALGVADTDDTDTPIEGGVKAKTRAKLPSEEEVKDLFDNAPDADAYRAAVKVLQQWPPNRQVAFDKGVIRAAQERLGITPGQKKPA